MEYNFGYMSLKEKSVIKVGFIDYYGSGKAHQSNTVYSSFGVSPCLCSYTNRYGGIQSNILVKEIEKTNNSNY